MKFLILISALIAACQGTYPHHGVTIGLTEYSHPILSQYQAQDVYGQYSYGYATPTSTKSETKSADGTTHGGYSYIDSHGQLQTVHYVADPVHGFRVAATNLPVDAPEVAYEKARHLHQFEATKAEHAAIGALMASGHGAQIAAASLPVDLPEVAYAKARHLAEFEAVKQEHALIGAARLAGAHNPVQVAHIPVAPAPVQDLPEVIKARAQHLQAIEATKIRDAHIAAEHAALAARNSVNLSPIPDHFSGAVLPAGLPVVVPSPVVQYATKAAYATYVPAIYGDHNSQYHAQDVLGQYTYGYAGPLSSKSETKTADGVVRGGYSYIDANGILQSVHYVADPVHGFRVAATNLPVGHATASHQVY